MAVYVNTNVSSLQGQRSFNYVNNSLNIIYQRLSTGLRINSAKDDSAGLQILDRVNLRIDFFVYALSLGCDIGNIPSTSF